MNTEGSAQAIKRKKTRRLKKRRLQDCRPDVVEIPTKKFKKQTAAPENTTQFLMDDREKVEPFINYVNVYSPSSSPTTTCSNSTSSVRGSPVDDKEFQYCSDIEENFDQHYFEKDFNDVYDNIQAETLFSLSKQELISKYLDLEKKEEDLLKRVRSMNYDETPFLGLQGTPLQVQDSSSPSCRSAYKDDKNCLISQLQELRYANSQLMQENERLRGC
ncbi:hypothetical protein QZH41_007982 [Actinostola sp. cb2023]|nr:hypothetical protein QZH41_007982 [Actinostola sp. cb2023]